MVRVYHGTSYENGQSILKNGFNPESRTWDVSLDDCMYFAYDLEEESYAKAMAIDEARITAALNHSSYTGIYVFSIEVDESIIEEYGDSSCENMSDIAIELPLEIANQYTLKYELIENMFIPSLGLVYLANANINYLNLSKLTDCEYELLQNKKARTLLSETSELVEMI